MLRLVVKQTLKLQVLFYISTCVSCN